MTNGSVAVAAVVMFLAVAPTCMAADQAPRNGPGPVKSEAAKHYPLIVAYTVSWCPHCQEAKKYLTGNHIPFVNRDVEKDPKAMAELTGRYHSQGVPVIVIGTGADEIVVEGFSPELFEEALKKAQQSR